MKGEERLYFGTLLKQTTITTKLRFGAGYMKECSKFPRELISSLKNLRCFGAVPGSGNKLENMTWSLFLKKLTV